MHKTVLLKETIDGLNLSDGSVVLDATYGGGGHTAEILNRFPKAKVIAYDQDQSVWKGKERVEFRNENFRNIDENEKVDGIIFDLGLSSDQLESSGRGFSFMRDEPLLMTMKENPSPEDITAQDVVNTWSEESLAKIIAGYGEERFANKIAQEIVAARPLETTFDLLEAIRKAVPGRYQHGRTHFATRTFQAIRIAVNDELGALSEGLAKGYEALKPGGRMAVISFHSLEDRTVKNFYKQKGKKINKKPIIPGAEEIKENPRSRSAKLRILEKI